MCMYNLWSPFGQDHTGSIHQASQEAKLLEILGRCECRRRINKQQGLGMCSAIMEPALTFYKSLKRRSSIVLARILSALACVSAVLLPRRQLFTVRRVNRPSFPLFQGTLGIGETICLLAKAPMTDLLWEKNTVWWLKKYGLGPIRLAET